MNPSLPYFSRYNHKWNPRRMKPIRYNNVYNPTMLYGAQSFITKGTTEKQWIGKYLVPLHMTNKHNSNNYVLEETIAKFAGMYRYRILFGKGVNNQFIFDSKPTIENRPKQMNILLDQYGIINDVLYF